MLRRERMDGLMSGVNLRERSLRYLSSPKLTSHPLRMDGITSLLKKVLIGAIASLSKPEISKPEIQAIARRPTLSLSRELLTFMGGQVKAFTHSRNPIPLGTHPIQIPDFPHGLGEGYIAQSRHA